MERFEIVPVDELPSHGNIRDPLSDSNRAILKRSIEANGIVVPLIGYFEGTQKHVIDGYQRLDLAKALGIKAVPMILADHKPTAAEVLTLQLVANCHRFGLKTMERVRAMDRLMTEGGCSAKEVSLKLTGPSQGNISKLLSLLVHPRDVQDLIDARRLPMSSAYAIARVPDAAERERLINEVVSGRLTRDKLVAVIKAGKRNKGCPETPKRSTRPRRARVVVPLGGGRSITVAGPGLAIDALLAWLDELVQRINGIRTDGMELSEAVRLLAAQNT